MKNFLGRELSVGDTVVSFIPHYHGLAIELSESQVENLMEFFEFNFIDYIRTDTEIENIDYVADMCEIYTKLKAAKKKLFGDG